MDKIKELQKEINDEKKQLAKLLKEREIIDRQIRQSEMNIHNLKTNVDKLFKHMAYLNTLNDVSTNNETIHKCKKCNKCYESRNKLFNHLLLNEEHVV